MSKCTSCGKLHILKRDLCDVCYIKELEDEIKRYKRIVPGTPCAESEWVALVARAEAANKRISELQELADRVKNGFQGGCWCCETVAEKNIELQRKYDMLAEHAAIMQRKYDALVDRGRELVEKMRRGNTVVEDDGTVSHVPWFGNKCADELRALLEDDDE